MPRPCCRRAWRQLSGGSTGAAGAAGSDGRRSGRCGGVGQARTGRPRAEWGRRQANRTLRGQNSQLAVFSGTIVRFVLFGGPVPKTLAVFQLASSQALWVWGGGGRVAFRVVGRYVFTRPPNGISGITKKNHKVAKNKNLDNSRRGCERCTPTTQCTQCTPTEAANNPPRLVKLWAGGRPVELQGVDRPADGGEAEDEGSSAYCEHRWAARVVSPIGFLP